MLKVEHEAWGQTISDLYRAAMDSPHRRTRERFLGLHAIASGAATATSWAANIGREDETVMRWVHAYNANGPKAMTYRRTGGSRPFFRMNKPRRSARRSPPANLASTV